VALHRLPALARSSMPVSQADLIDEQWPKKKNKG
jgi:hypothetical protein